EILDTHGIRSTFEDLKPVVDAAEISQMIDIARQVHVAPSVKAYIVDLVEGTRRHAEVMLGASPRSALFLQRVARTRAAMEGREYVTPDDVKDLAVPVLAHRMALRPEAHMRGTTIGEVLEGVVRHLRVPGTRDSA
ncbi:MAG: MoxR family ATPase, partial [Acidimicrobiia bacterium]|nr:MoxR family ATPase [Acidimicrobiia bacterium]